MTWAQVAKFFSDHSEAIITLVIGSVLSIWGSWYYFRRGEKSKRLGFEIVSGNRIISASADQRQHLVVTYKDQDKVREVKNPYVLVLRVRNIGELEIKDDDYTIPITFRFGDAELVAHKITKGSSTIKIIITEEPRLIKYTPELLNRDDWFEIQFVTDGDPQLWVDTRFAGQSDPIANIADLRSRTQKRMRTYVVGVPATLTLIVFFLLLAIIGPELLLGDLETLGVFLAALLTVGVAFFVLVGLPIAFFSLTSDARRVRKRR